MKEYLKYKKYAHFDKKMSISKAKKIINDEVNINNHGFFPFIHYSIKYKKLENVNGKVYAKKEPKMREIFYCSHLDRYIYQKYAHEIGIKYNEYMENNNIDECSGAYRINKGKSNINFSFKMINYIKKTNNSIIIVGDFTKFFDILNHLNLKRRLEKVLCSKLDKITYKIFKSITKFKYVELEDLYDYFTIKNGKRSEKYYLRKINTLMDRKEFKEFIKSKNPKSDEKYLKENDNNYGIIQGSPLSGLMANIYMIDFDYQMNELSKKYNGKYLRYSDDFMLILNNIDINEVKNIFVQIQTYVNDAGQVQLEPHKTNIYLYSNNKINCINQEILGTSNVPNIINFLGFSFNGNNVSIRNKTLSKYNYKMEKNIKRYYLKNKETRRDIYEKYSFQGDRNNFISYVKRAEKIFKNEEKITKVRKNSKKKVTEKLGKLKK